MAVVSKRKATPARQALFVLGMHRSGTSAIGGLLTHLGARAPKTLMTPTKDNPHGYWESVEFMKVHDRILSSAGSRWNDWGAFNPDWMDSAVAAELTEALVELLGREFADAPLFLIKDPRVCRFFPLWLEVLRAPGITPKVIIPIRHPLDVARSLEVRDHFGRNRSLLLWLRHMLDAEMSSRQVVRTFVHYESVLADWQTQARRVAADLAISWPKWSGDTEAKIAEFLTTELRHHASADTVIPGDTELADWAGQVYSTLLRAVQGPLDEASLANLDRIRTEFNRTSGIYAAVVREHETRVEGLYASVKARLAEKSLQAQELETRHAEVTQRLVISDKAMAEQRAGITVLAGQVEAREAENAKLQQQWTTEVVQLRERLVVTERTVAELRAQLEAASSEQVQMREAHERQRREAADQLSMLANENTRLTTEHEGNIAEMTAKLTMLAACNTQLADEHQHGIAALTERVAERDARLAKAAADQAELTERVERQAVDLVAQREALMSSEAAVELRFRETAKLTEMVLELEKSSLRQEQALQQKDLALRDSTARQQAIAQDHAVYVAKQAGEQTQRELLHQAQAKESARKLALAEFKHALAHSANNSLRRQVEAWQDTSSRYQQLLEQIRSTRFRRFTAPLLADFEMAVVAPAVPDAGFAHQVALLRESDLFDSTWYLETYPEAAQSGHEPVHHYLLHGAASGNNPGPQFDTVAYLVRYADVRHAAMNPLVHYLEHGKREARVVTPPEAARA